MQLQDNMKISMRRLCTALAAGRLCRCGADCFWFCLTENCTNTCVNGALRLLVPKLLNKTDHYSFTSPETPS